MLNKRGFFAFILIVFTVFCVFSQSHLAVPLGDPIYHVLEHAQLRGLLRFLPHTKPYSQAFILSLIDEVLANDRETTFFRVLTQQERRILEQFKRDFSPREPGTSLLHGTITNEHVWNDVYFSGEFGFSLETITGIGYYPQYDGEHFNSGDSFTDIDTRLVLSFKGDLGKSLSYGLTVQGGFFKSPRSELGLAYPYYAGYSPSSHNEPFTVYSEPLAHFPYTYNKNWDGAVWYTTNINNAGHETWPYELSIGYSMFPELSGSFFNGHIQYRIASLQREWGGMTNNSSLILNQTAQPFLAGELMFMPFEWISFSGLAGVLEYSGDGIKDAAGLYQNAFSVNMLEININKIIHINFGSSAVYGKRFELGYLFPIADNFLYQNNIGDFDNMALFLNLKGQIPGIARLWFSFFMDEVNPEGDFFEKARQMYALQLGGTMNIPWITFTSFTSLTLSYTKVEPYTYTHPREVLPWFGDNRMYTNYINNDRGLGSYLPPNSDEFLVRLDTVPIPQSMLSLQYQLIRHGAAYGSSAAGGSSLWSELAPEDRSGDPRLRKFFLEDGAYKWMHIFKISGEYSFTGMNLPVRVFCELGTVYSYFTNIDGKPVIGDASGAGSPGAYSVINTPEYPHSFSFHFVVGIKIFPK